MATTIIPATCTAKELQALLDKPAQPRIGRMPVRMRANELSETINQHPTSVHERQERVEKMRRLQMLVPVDEAMEFAEFGYDSDSTRSVESIVEELNWS